ncbi:hypothetical protein MGN70_003752 [Eutypa lata]|nr:hypothetical protein MGN70_003752 [Eutypa lata]
MTTNSYGLALPQFDFPPEVSRAARSTSRGLPRSARTVPVIAAAGLATYYVGSRLASRGETILARDGAATFDAMDYAYGDSTNLMKIGSTSRASAHPPTPANVRFQEAMKRAREH